MRTPAPDKTLHFGGGALTAAAGFVLAAVAMHFRCPISPWIFGPGAVVAAALLREAYNLWRGSRWSNADIAWTIAGGAISCLCFYLGASYGSGR